MEGWWSSIQGRSGICKAKASARMVKFDNYKLGPPLRPLYNPLRPVTHPWTLPKSIVIQIVFDFLFCSIKFSAFVPLLLPMLMLMCQLRSMARSLRPRSSKVVCTEMQSMFTPSSKWKFQRNFTGEMFPFQKPQKLVCMRCCRVPSISIQEWFNPSIICEKTPAESFQGITSRPSAKKTHCRHKTQ